MKNVLQKDQSQLTKMGPDTGYETRDQLLKRRFLSLNPYTYFSCVVSRAERLIICLVLVWLVERLLVDCYLALIFHLGLDIFFFHLTLHLFLSISLQLPFHLTLPLPNFSFQFYADLT